MFKIKNFGLSPDTVIQLFESFVGSILNYGSEVWGFSKANQLERVHPKFLKRLLYVKRSTSNQAVYGETGRMPLYLTRYKRLLRYWFKLVNNNINEKNFILSKVYTMLKADVESGKSNWLSNIKGLLERCGFADVWLNPYSFHKDSFIRTFEQRVFRLFQTNLS